MTKIQIEEFQKLEMAYLDSVRTEDADKQMRMMELIFFWLRKQMRAVQGDILVKMFLTQDKQRFEPAEVTEMQKGEFTFLQMAMITAVGKDDREKMIEVEIKMREWIDIQITRSVSKIIKPDFKIIRKPKN